MANRWFTQFFGTMHKKPVMLDCNFKVLSTNASGITNLKGPGIANVFMHTSTTPTTGSPNPANGLIYVNFQDNYYNYFLSNYIMGAALSGSDINISTGSSLTLNAAYTITAVGTTTTAQWVTVGVPVGITPAVGVTFFAAATSGTGTGKVQVSVSSNIAKIDVVGSPNTTLQSSAATVLGVSNGSYLVLGCMAPVVTMGAYTPAGTNSIPTFTGSALGTHTHSIPPGTDGSGGTSGATSGGTPAGTVSAPTFTGSAASLTGTVSYALAAPTNGTQIYLSFYLGNTSILVQGE